MGKGNAGPLFLYAAGLLGANFVVACLLASCAVAQRTDGFEGGAPRWLLVESDCQAQLTGSEISRIMPHGGQTSELVEVSCGSGSRALLAYPIESCLVLREFQPRAWIRCSSGEIRLGVRVIFPADKHPVTGGRLTTILWGERYTTPGAWQALQVTELERLLNTAKVSLRSRFGTALSLDGAYIDSLVLNVYTGPGRYRAQIDDVNMGGLVPLTALGGPKLGDWRRSWRWRIVMPSAENRFWAAANRPPVWIQHTGESYPWLASLGINGVLLNRLPDPQQLAKINASSLGVICPPPENSVELKESDAAAIKGWLVGAAMDGQQVQRARQQARLASRLDANLSRPLIGEALERHWQFGRIADEVFVPQRSRSAAGSWASKQIWLASKLAVLRPRAEGWVSVNVDLGPAIRRQYQALASIVDPSGRLPDIQRLLEAGLADSVLDEAMLQNESLGANAPDAISDPLGFRHQVVSAVIAGARGVLLRTSRPLVDGEIADHALIASVRWTNNDLRLWGPWMVGGQLEEPPVLNRQDYSACVRSVSQSQLVVAGTTAAASQYCIPPTMDQPLEIELPRFQTGQQVIRLTRGRMETIPVDVTPTGYRFQVSRPAPVEAFVVTSNPLVLKFVRRELARVASSNAADQLDIAKYNMSIASKLVDARFNRGGTDAIRIAAARPLLEQLAQAQRLVNEASQAARAGQALAASQLTMLASDAIQSVLFDSHRVATSNLAAAQSSPYVLCPATLHLHWMLAEACGRSTWQTVPLPGGEFEDLGQMLGAGWTQQRRNKPELDLRVELVPPDDGTNGLRLAAYQNPADARPVESLEGGYEGASLRVRSASAHVAPGSLVRVSATARILKSTSQPDCGVLVYDNQAGPSLGQLVQGEKGDRVHVEMYRFMISGDDEFRILAECRGECDIVLEDVEINAIKPARKHPRYTTTPITIETK